MNQVVNYLETVRVISLFFIPLKYYLLRSLNSFMSIHICHWSIKFLYQTSVFGSSPLVFPSWPSSGHSWLSAQTLLFYFKEVHHKIYREFIVRLIASIFITGNIPRYPICCGVYSSKSLSWGELQVFYCKLFKTVAATLTYALIHCFKCTFCPSFWGNKENEI